MSGYAQEAILAAEELYGPDNWSLDTILQEKGKHASIKAGSRDQGHGSDDYIHDRGGARDSGHDLGISRGQCSGEKAAKVFVQSQMGEQKVGYPGHQSSQSGRPQLLRVYIEYDPEPCGTDNCRCDLYDVFDHFFFHCLLRAP